MIRIKPFFVLGLLVVLSLPLLHSIKLVLNICMQKEFVKSNLVQNETNQQLLNFSLADYQNLHINNSQELEWNGHLFDVLACKISKLGVQLTVIDDEEENSLQKQNSLNTNTSILIEQMFASCFAAMPKLQIVLLTPGICLFIENLFVNQIPSKIHLSAPIIPPSLG